MGGIASIGSVTTAAMAAAATDLVAQSAGAGIDNGGDGVGGGVGGATQMGLAGGGIGAGVKNTAGGAVSGGVPPVDVVSLGPGAGVVAKDALAMRPKVWDGRECDQCGLQIHEADSRFCRRCGTRLGSTESAGTLYVRRAPSVREAAEKKRKATKPVGSRSLPFRPANQQAAMAVGRLGVDITASTMAGFRKDQADKRNAAAKKKGGGAGGPLPKRRTPSDAPPSTDGKKTF